MSKVMIELEELERIQLDLDQVYAYLIRLEELNSILNLKKTVTYSPLTLKIEKNLKFITELLKQKNPTPLRSVAEKKAAATVKKVAQRTVKKAVAE